MKRVLVVLAFLAFVTTAWIFTRSTFQSDGDNIVLRKSSPASETEIPTTKRQPAYATVPKQNREQLATVPESVEVEIFSTGFRKVRLSPEVYSAVIEKREADLQEIIRKDVAAGINEEARSKEERLRISTQELQAGTTPDQVIQILGSPDRTQVLITNGNTLSLTVGKATSGMEMYWSYWPRVGVPFDGRYGQGYKVLYLYFNDDHRLEKWLWQQPSISYAGSLNMVRKQKDYWEGAHTISPPPPADSITDDLF
jgi:hypothetical protein